MSAGKAFSSLKPQEHSFRLPLAVTVVSIIFATAAPNGPIWRMISFVLMTVAIILSLQAAERMSNRRHAVVGVILLGLMLSTIGTAGGQHYNWVRGVGQIIGSLPMIYVSVEVIRWIGRQPKVTADSVLGGLLVYLMTGLMFSQLYGAVADLSKQGLFCGVGDGTHAERVYYSFIAITTTGFGDFTTCTQVGRAISMVEAMFGQVYLVTIIALLVGNMGRTRRHPGELDTETPTDTPDS